MNRLPLLGAALASLLLTAPGARADLVPWAYNWTPGVTVITSDTGGGQLQLTNEPLGHALGDTDIVATNIKAFSSASPDAPDVFTNRPYSLILSLKDTLSGAVGTMTFTGVTTQSITLGDSTYTVTINNYAPPAPPGAINAGAISAFAEVSVNPAGAAPEPSACALACVGLASAAGAFWRRRRRAKVAGG